MIEKSFIEIEIEALEIIVAETDSKSAKLELIKLEIELAEKQNLKVNNYDIK